MLAATVGDIKTKTKLTQKELAQEVDVSLVVHGNGPDVAALKCRSLMERWGVS